MMADGYAFNVRARARACARVDARVQYVACDALVKIGVTLVVSCY